MNKKQILIVDDKEQIAKILYAYLQADYDCHYVQNPLHAIKRLLAGHMPDLIISDIRMPEMRGYEALRGVREIAPDVPVIALTAYAFETDRQRMFQAGFNECLAKPLRADELRTRITALLSR